MKNKIINLCIIIVLISLTMVFMNYPFNITKSKFWIMIMLILFEIIIVILVSCKKKKKKKVDKKILEKQNNILIISNTITLLIVILGISYLVNIFKEINTAKKSYPSGIMGVTVEFAELQRQIIVPTYTINNGSAWSELYRFKNPKDEKILEEELLAILNDETYYEKIETQEKGTFYYNSSYDYTIIGYDITKGLIFNGFNLVLCDGYCTD